MEKRLTFAYGTSLAMSRLVLCLLAFALVIAFAVIAGSLPLLPLAGFGAFLAAATVIFAVSPLLTQHWLTRSRLILRQGWYFRVGLAMSEIESLIPADETVPLRAPLGIHRPLGQPTLYVAGGRTGFVIVRLARPRRFWSSFGLEASEIVFDVRDRDAFLRAYEERRSLLSPIQADRPDADLRD
jgi:hypothetical protein